MTTTNSILLVEDDDNHAEIFEFFANLQFSDLIINRLTDGEAAINYINSRTEERKDLPSLIVLDLNLPRFSGLEVLEKIKSHPIAKSIPIVILTSSGSKEDISKAWSAGVNSYLRKPLETKEFKPLIKLVIDYWQSNEMDKNLLFSL